MIAKHNYMNLEQFKNDILFNAIHKEERYSTIDEYLKTAKRIYQFNKGELFDGDSSHSVYCSIGLRINYLKGLISVCNDLQKRGYSLQPLVKVEDNYYQEFFKKDLVDIVKSYPKGFFSTSEEKYLNNK
jgi:hypothetical protein